MSQLSQSRTGDRLSTIVTVPFDISTVKAETVVDALETIVVERSGDRPRKLAMPQMNGNVHYDFVWVKMGSFDQAYAIAVGPFLDVFAIDPTQKYHRFGIATYPHPVPGVSSGTPPDEETIEAYFKDITGLVKADLVKAGLVEERLF